MHTVKNQYRGINADLTRVLQSQLRPLGYVADISLPGHHAYRITVIDPRPEFLRGEGRSRQFNVDAAIPTVEIPLNAGDIIAVDFGAPYRKTFEEMFYGDRVDYGQFPVNFDHYTPADQHRIATRMLTVLTAPATETPPLTVDEAILALSLDELKARIAAHT